MSRETSGPGIRRVLGRSGCANPPDGSDHTVRRAGSEVVVEKYRSSGPRFLPEDHWGRIDLE